MRNKLTHLDLFSGIGGFSLGLEATGGFETIGFSEIDDYANEVLKKHWPNVPNFGDIGNVPALKCFIATAGIPCQPFSIAGRQGGASDNRDQRQAVLDAFARVRPDFIIVENVVNFANLVLREFQDDLESLGYQSVAFDISACAVGLQTMERHIWIVAASNRARLEGLRNIRFSSKQKEFEKRNGRQDYSKFERIRNMPALPASKLLRSRKGIPCFVDRVRCIGNAIPPQIAQIFGEIILHVENNS